jgi:transposase
MRQPGPLRAFGQRIRGRRGYQIAAVAVARKIACLAWQLLTKGEDYAYARPMLTQRKVRRLELQAGHEHRRGKSGTVPGKSRGTREQEERNAVERSEAAYRRMIDDWKASGPKRHEEKPGAGVPSGRASKAARQGSAPEPAL